MRKEIDYVTFYLRYKTVQIWYLIIGNGRNEIVNCEKLTRTCVRFCVDRTNVW